MPSTSLSRLAGSNPVKPKFKERGGLFGTGIGPTVNLGLGTLASDIKNILPGLIQVGRSIAPGKRDNEPGLKQIGTGIGKSMATTISSLATPGFDIKSLQDRGIETSLSKRVAGRGLLPTLFEDVGNIAGIAAPAKAAMLGRVGRLSEGAAAAEAAGDIGRAAALTERATQLSGTAERLTKFAEPYRTAGQKLLSPATRTALERTKQLPGELHGPPLPDTPEYNPAAVRLAGKRKMPLTERTAPSPSAFEEYRTPGEKAALSRAEAPLDGITARLAARAPGALARPLAAVERTWQNIEMRRAVRERSLLSEAARRQTLSSPEMMALRQESAKLLTGKTLPDGTKVTAPIADQLVGDAVRARVTGVEALQIQAREAGIDLPHDVLAARGIRGGRQLPTEWLDPAHPDHVPGLDELVAHGVKTTNQITKNTVDVLHATRLADSGLERLGSSEPVLSSAERRTINSVNKKLLKAQEIRNWLKTNDTGQTLMGNTTEYMRATEALGKLETRADAQLAAVAESSGDTSILRTPPRMQPIMHAVQSLRDHAVQTGDVQLAEHLNSTAGDLETVLQRAQALGFDPQYIPKLQPDKVRRLVFETMRLGRGDQLGEIKAGARSRQYIHPELQDRSIAGLAAGYLDAVHEQNTNALVDHIERVYAQPIGDTGTIPNSQDWVPWSPTRNMLLTGNETSEGLKVGSGAQYMIPRSLNQQLRRLTKSADNPLAKRINTVTSPWRAFVLNLRPAWYVNNVMGGVVLAEASGARIGDWVNAWSDFRTGGGRVFKRGEMGRLSSTFGERSGATIGDVAEYAAINHPGLQETLVPRPGGRTEVQGETGSRVSGLKAGLESFGKANSVVDDLARVAAFHAKMRKGLDPRDALIEAHRAMVDYGNLTPIERSYVRAAVPFYAWQKNILRVAGKYAMDDPAVVGLLFQLSRVNEELMKDRLGTDLPGAYAGLTPVGEGAFNTAGWNPFSDAAGLLTPTGLASNLNPFVDLFMRDALGAPQSGYSNRYRVNEIGQAQMVPDTVGELAGMATYLPQAQALQGGTKLRRFLGDPQYSPEELQKIVTRTTKSRAKVAGQSLATSQPSTASKFGLKIPNPGAKLKRQLTPRAPG